MSEQIFSASDFSVVFNSDDAARIANEKLSKLLGPEVFGIQEPDKSYRLFSEFKADDDTHTARLFNVQEIKPKVDNCEHEPMQEIRLDDKGGFEGRWVCDKCGVKLKATWAVDE